MSQLYTNNASSLLVNNISSTDTTILVSPGTGGLFPPISGGDDFFIATMEDQFGNYEIVRVNNRVGDSMFVERNWEASGAKAFSQGDRFELRFTAGSVEQFLQREGDRIEGGLF